MNIKNLTRSFVKTAEKYAALFIAVASLTMTGSACNSDNDDREDDPLPATSEVKCIKLNQTFALINAGESTLITTVLYPERARNEKVEWTSSDPGIATVKDGTVNTYKSGSATITARCGEITEECEIRVTGQMFRASIKLNQLASVINSGESIYLKAKGNKVDHVKWTSSNPSVATVADGKVTAIRMGEATITATATDGAEATCDISVMMYASPKY